MSHPSYIAYMPPEVRNDGFLLVTRAVNFADPTCPAAFDSLSRRRVSEPRVQHFILTRAEYDQMTRH